MAGVSPTSTARRSVTDEGRFHAKFAIIIKLHLHYNAFCDKLIIAEFMEV